MKIIGYARVSTVHQQLDSQINALNKYGCTSIYTEQESGRKTNRPKLEEALNALNPGDTFVIFKLDRLSRGTQHLLSLMDYFNEHEINFVSIQNNIDTSTSMGKFFFTIMGAFAEMEAELIRERVISGLDAARENGVILGRPPLDKDVKKIIYQYTKTDLTVTKIAELNKVSRPTVYRYLKQNNIDVRKKTRTK